MRFSEKKYLLVLLFPAAWLTGLVLPDDYPFAPAAGQAGSTAVSFGDSRFLAWADEVVDIRFGTGVDSVFRDTDMALGPAGGGGMDLLTLGRAGEVVLSFSGLIANGSGNDFAVFENAFSDDFIELAWVEVSSDGEHFVRFPNYSATAHPVGAFGSVQPQQVHGFAGKYRQGYGTPFDLQDLIEAHALVVAGEAPFSDDYQAHLLSAFPLLNMEAVRFVRLVDVVGDGSARSAISDAEGAGFPVYDPYPTAGSAGFDLDAVGIMHYTPDLVSYAELISTLGISEGPELDADKDGDANGLEFLTGSDLLDAASVRYYEILAGEGGFNLRLIRDPRSLGELTVLALQPSGNWAPLELEVIRKTPLVRDGQVLEETVFLLPSNVASSFIRLRADFNPN